MGVTNLDTISAGLGAAIRSVAGKKYTYDDFSGRPLFVDDDGDGAPTGTTGDENIMLSARGNGYEYHILGTQTIVKPAYGASGLDIGMDQTDNDGVEISQGIIATSRSAFTVGTHDAFVRVKLNVADVSGTDDCAVGFRKAEAYQANIDDYDEMACLNLISGNLNIETILNNAATTTTDTTDNVADGVDVEMEVRVDIDGAVTYVIDGAAPTTTAAFSFDSGEVIVPFLYFLHASDVAGVVLLKEWECGTFQSRGLRSALDYDN